MVRIPTHRPPTHPGEMLLEESDTALRLERLLGVEAQVWLNVQLAWDLYHATHSKTAQQIQQIKPLKRAG